MTATDWVTIIGAIGTLMVAVIGAFAALLREIRLNRKVITDHVRKEEENQL